MLKTKLHDVFYIYLIVLWCRIYVCSYATCFLIYMYCVIMPTLEEAGDCYFLHIGIHPPSVPPPMYE